jgi:hypothetical protein
MPEPTSMDDLPFGEPLTAPNPAAPKRVLAIDPGSQQSAWIVLQDGRPDTFGIEANDTLAAWLRGILRLFCDVVVIEQIEPRYGLQAGWEVLDTARWVGRFEEAASPVPVARLKRSEILRHLGVVTQGKARVSADAGVRAALVDRYGGKDAAIGRKANPGPLHGISRDVWAALAVAVTFSETRR